MNRQEHWESIYKDKSPAELGWYQKQPVISLELIRKFAKDQSDYIIDVGGGASNLCDYLLDEGFKNITVLDLSSHAITCSQQRLGNKSALINWRIADVTQFVPDCTYDIWHDRAVFHFLTDKNDREQYRRVMEAATTPGSHVIVAAFTTGGPAKCSGLDVVQYDCEKLQVELGQKFVYIEERFEMHITPGGQKQAYGYYVFERSKT